MRTRTSLRRLLPPLCLLAPLAGAQGGVIVVDDDGGFDFTDLQDAVDAAASGDTILVRSGEYESLVIDGKSLSVIAELDAKVAVTGTSIGADVVAVRNLAAGGHVRIRGLDVPLAAASIERAVDLVSNAGAVWIEDLTLTPVPDAGWIVGASTDPDAMVVVEDCAAVNLTRVTVTGNPGVVVQPSGLSFLHEPSPGADAVRVDDSSISIWDSALTGGVGSTATFGPTDAPIAATDGGVGLAIHGGSLFASSTGFQGGEGGGANPFFWGCLSAANGGAGLVIDGATAEVTTLASTFAGGGPGPAGVCSPSGQPGPPTTIVAGSLTTLPGTGRSFTATGPHREGQTATLSYEGAAGDLLFHILGGTQQHVFVPLASGVLTTLPLSVTFAGSLGASGQATAAVPIPSFVDPGLLAAHVYVQAVFVEVAGPISFLGSGSLLTLLDASL